MMQRLELLAPSALGSTVRLVVRRAASLGVFGTVLPLLGVWTGAAFAEEIARVGERSISVDEVGYTARSASDPAAVDQALRERVEFELLLASARKAGFDRRPDVAEALRRVIVERYAREVLTPQLNAIRVTEEELRAEYEARRAEFTAPPSVRGAVIRISVPARASEERRAVLAARAAQARSEALGLDPDARGLGAAAARFSDDQASRYRGGETGWLSVEEPGPWGAEVVRALTEIGGVGEVGPVLVTESAFYVLRLLEARPERTRSLAEVRGQLEHGLMREKRAEVRAAIFDPLRAEFPVEVDQQVLLRLQQAEASPPKAPE